MNCFKKVVFISILCLIIQISGSATSKTRVRETINIPDILDYTTLKCDFHIHTVFSDGSVWPTVRADEAWRHGLDAFAITDHIEYLPHKEDIPANFNRSYEIAQPGAERLNLTPIKGAEITRDMPPGHFNAIFLQDIDSLDTPEWRNAIKAAIDQGSFIFWNHPGWSGQQPDGVAKWYDEHDELYEKGWLHGIEVVNGEEYYPEAHKWGLEKNLTMVCNSDIHNPISMDYDLENSHRPLTLVFANENTRQAIKEALFSQRTVVYWQNNLIGEAKYLEPIFYNSIKIEDRAVEIKGKQHKGIQIHNYSDIDYELASDGQVTEISVPKNITLYGGQTVLFWVGGKSEDLAGQKEIEIPYRVTNLKVHPDEGLSVKLKLNLTFGEVNK